MGISLKEVSYSYNKLDKPALSNINLDIKTNDEFISIVGETGSGKSTLASIFNYLKVPKKGTLIINDLLIKKNKKIPYNKIRKHVGLCFQFSDYQLFEESVLKDVSFGPSNFGNSKEDSIKLAKNALSLVDMDESYYNKSPFDLSGGEKRLASIAGILACDNDIIVFDEPTAGLDAYKKNLLLNLLRKLNEEYHKTIIIITHDMNIALEYSKRIILLSHGEMLIDTDPITLFNGSNDEIIKKANIDLPDSIRLRNYLNKKCNLNLKTTFKSTDDLLKELLK